MKGLRTLLARLWPRRLMSQTIVLLIIALFSAQIISALIVRGQTLSFYRGAETRFIAERIAPLAALLRDTPPALQDKIASTLANRHQRVWMSSVPAVGKPDEHDDHDDMERSRDLAARIAQELDDHHAGHIRVIRRHEDDVSPPMMTRMKIAMGIPVTPASPPGKAGQDATVVSIALGADRWMNTALQSRPPRRLIRPDGWITFFVTAIVISMIVAFALRRITRPLAQLSTAAGKLGRGEAIAPLKEEGPADIRDTIRAFNEMQDRLHKYIADRTQMLAAISHDLRTPITSLRLRAEMLDDDEARERMIATLSDMQNMVEATLAFARAEASTEPTRVTDLAALIEAVCEDLLAIGHKVSLKDTERLSYPCRPVALRRALTNLIDNAATYGDKASVTLDNTKEGPQIIIEDNGPGVPEHDIERIFEPFVRLETSRNTETGGIGLGMAIARDIIRRHGGEITLSNRTEGGLRVCISLPAVSA